MFIVEKVRFKNFRSYGNQWTEFDLQRNNTTVVSGKNGQGKTSWFMAISFALFGKVIGVKKPSLINDINLKECVVEIECSNNGKRIFIRRGIKPEVFDIIIDGELVDQSASNRDYQKWFEEYILGFNIQSFQQVCFITGSTYTPFFLLSAGARRKMVEDLLSITIFSKMYSLHILEANQIKEKINKTMHDIESTSEVLISLKKALNVLSSKDSTFKEMIQNGIASLSDNRLELEANKTLLEEEIVSIGNTQSDLIDLKKLENKLSKAMKIDADLTRTKNNSHKFIKFLKENDHCPTCSSDLDEEFKMAHTCTKEKKILEVDVAKTNLESVIDSVKEQIDLIAARQKEFKRISQSISTLNSEIKGIDRRIDEEKKKLNSVSSSNESELKRDIIEKNALLESLKEQKISSLIEKQYNELQGAILKDSGIKTRIINQMLPKMNQMLQHYVQSLELGCSIVIDENFNEVIYRRFKDPTTYSGLSAGEKTRVDIAMFFTWREIAKAKNSLNCNLLLLDEIFDNTLDDVGLDIFVSLLKKDFKDSNVFMISHRPEIIDKFESNIVIGKVGNFSKIL